MQWTWRAALGIAVLGIACATAKPANPKASRFALVEEIRLLPEPDESPVPMQPLLAPRYFPRSASHARSEIIVLALVVDVNGQIEPGTLTVVRPPTDHAFAEAVCEYMRGVEYRAPVPQRTLVTTAFTFGISDAPMAPPLTSGIVRGIVSRLKGMSREELFAFLEKQPSCRR